MGQLAPGWFDVLRCPVCKQELDRGGQSHFVCREPRCGRAFPIIDGRPVLINEDRSVFRIDDFVARRQTTFRRGGKLKRMVSRLLPGTSVNLKARENCMNFKRLVLQDAEKPKVLIIGGGELGQGLDAIIESEEIEFVQSDVAFESRTQLICDCHDLPYPHECFDGVIIQAVLEHVVDPHRCVQEIHRILKAGGLIYVETPFLQPVHMGRYDFTRFTDLGLRRLCRQFEEIDRGAICGAGMALAGAYQAFLKSLTRSKAARKVLAAFGRITSFWLKYFDYWSIDTPATLDAASGLFFMGRKSNHVLSDEDLLALYRGASSL
ncbi:MAG: methyltransferase domain-containing protein [Planctomycetota bacterium]